MDDDAHLKQIFKALKQEDMRRAPDADTILQRAAMSGRPLGRRLPLYRIAAMLALLAFGFGWFYHYHHRNLGLPELNSVTMAQWHSPTDALLAFPGRPLSDSLNASDQLGPTWGAPLKGPAIPRTYFLDMPTQPSSKAVL